MKQKLTKGEIQSQEKSIFLKTYKDKTFSEMVGMVGIKEESKLSDYENILFTIISLSSYKFETQYSLLNMKSLLESLISSDSKETEYFKNKLKEVENLLDKGNGKRNPRYNPS